MPITKLCKIAAQDPPTSLLRCPKDHKISPPPCIGAEKRKQVSIICPCTSMQACSFRHFHYVFRSSTLHFNSFAVISASAPHVRYARSFYEPKIHPHCFVPAYRRRAVGFPTSCNLRKSVFLICVICVL